jgi:hypothetical protein
MCADGIYFSTRSSGEMQLARGADGFRGLSVFDDKCLVIGPQDTIDLSVQMISDDFEDQLYVYYSFTNFTSISGNASFELANWHITDGVPIFVRIVADDFSPPNAINIWYDVAAPPARNPRWDYMLPHVLLQVCDVPIDWKSEDLAIVLVVSASVFGLACLICICYLSIRRPGTDRHTNTGEGYEASLMTIQERIFSPGWN